MSVLRVLSRAEVARLLPSIDTQLDLVEETYVEMATGQVELPPKPGIHPRKDAFIHAMPSYLRRSDVAAVKWVSGYPANPARGLPYISGVIVVNDAETGVPIGMMDAAEITAARTAAASGVCIRALAPRGWRRAAILGCGEQGRYHVEVLRTINPDLTIHAYDVDEERARHVGPSVEVVSSARDAANRAEVVITAGPIMRDPSPVIDSDWLEPRCLLLPIDFDFYVRSSAITAAELFLVDDRAQYEYYRGQGHFQDWPEPSATVGEYIAGATDRLAMNRVVCTNLGVGALDAAFSHAVLTEAQEAGVGTVVTL